MTEPLTLYKLIVLYMLGKVNFSMTNEQLCDFILTQGYTDYSKLQRALSELVDAQLIQAEVIRNNTYYTINEKGRDTVKFFDHKISDAIKEDIHQYLKKNEYELREEVSVLSDYDRTPDQEYVVHMRVLECGSNLLEIKVRVPTEEAARVMCDRWETKNQAVYAFLMQKLLNSGKTKE